MLTINIIPFTCIYAGFWFTGSHVEIEFESCKKKWFTILDGNYTRTFFDDEKPLLASRTLKDFEEILVPHGFIRAHRSHMVNKLFVESVLFDGFIEMKDKSKIEISRRRKEIVMQELKKP